jgi:hyaluronan synthase
MMPTCIVIYFLTGHSFVRPFDLSDLLMRMVWTYAYLGLRNPYRGRSAWEWLWVVPAYVFYYGPLPAIQFWSMATVLQDSWGTTMRASGEIRKKSRLWTKVGDVGWFVLWAGILGGATARVLSGLMGIEPGLQLPLFLVATMLSWLAAGWWLVVAQ